MSSSSDYAREVLELEAQALLNIAPLLNEQFDNAVDRILNLSPAGRVVVSGMGKAGFIGMKLSATFASTGVPSFFLHPAEAVHGDLGRYSKSDIAVILSNSGETEEIVRTLGAIRRTGCPIIALTGNITSTLAKHSDMVLSIGKTTEAGPLGLAPTTSTTALLGLGDALAMAVLHKQNFSKEKFALYHPAGSLGRSLMPVTQIMRSEDSICIVSDTLLTVEVLHKITKTTGRPGAAAVVDSTGTLSGFFTDGDLRRYLERGTEFLKLPISAVMSKNPKSIHQSKLAEEALGILSEYKLDQLVVVNDKKQPVGMIDIQDVVYVR